MERIKVHILFSGKTIPQEIRTSTITRRHVYERISCSSQYLSMELYEPLVNELKQIIEMQIIETSLDIAHRNQCVGYVRTLTILLVQFTD